MERVIQAKKRLELRPAARVLDVLYSVRGECRNLQITAADDVTYIVYSFGKERDFLEFDRDSSAC